VLPLLEPQFCVHALDRRGYGNSGDGKRYRIEAEFKDIATLAARIKDAPVDVVAHNSARSAPRASARHCGGSLSTNRHCHSARRLFSARLAAITRDAVARGDNAAAVVPRNGLGHREWDAAQVVGAIYDGQL